MAAERGRNKGECLGIVFREKPALVLAALADQSREWYAAILAKEADCTYPHIMRVLSDFERIGLITGQEHGRKRIISLTSRGKAVAQLFFNIVKQI